MKAHRLLVDTTRYTTKPENVFDAQFKLRNNGVFELTIEQIAEFATQPYGYNFIFNSFTQKFDTIDENGVKIRYNGKTKYNKPDYHKGIQKDEYDGISSIFALDFDCDIKSETIIAALKNVGLRANIIYTTFSDTPEFRKLRVLCFIDEPFVYDVSTKELQNIAMLDMEEKLQTFSYLIWGYNEKKGKNWYLADDACKNINRVFYGGKQIELLDTIPNKKLDMELALETLALEHAKRTKKSKKATTVAETRYQLELSKSCEKLVEHFDFDDCIKNVRIVRELLNPTQTSHWFTYKELLYMAITFSYIKGGIERMRKAMELFNNINKGIFQNGEERFYNWNAIAVTYNCGSKKYCRTAVKDYSPFEEDKEISLDFLLHTQQPQGTIIKTNLGRKLYKMEEFAIDYKQKLDNILQNSDGKFLHIFKVSTGAGKTSILLKRLLDLPYGKRVIVASQDNKLKAQNFNDYVDLCNQFGVKCNAMQTPDSPKFSESLQNAYNSLHMSNNYKLAFELVKDVANSVKMDITYFDDDTEVAKHYVEAIYKSKNFDGILFTTHHRAILTDFDNFDTIFFDEDPTNVILQTDTFDLGDLIKTAKKSGIKELKKLITTIIAALPIVDGVKENIPYKTSDFITIDMKEQLDKIVVSKELKKDLGTFMKFLNSDYILRANSFDINTYYYGKKIGLGSLAGKNCVILSATVNQEIVNNCFSNVYESSDITEMEIERKGKYITITDSSMSKTVVKTKKDDKRFKEIITNITNSGLDVVTNIANKPMFKTAVEDIHYGKTSGFNNLSGKDIILFGTPTPPSSSTIMKAALLGYEVATKDLSMNNKNVEFEGCAFNFFTFEDVDLRRLQFYDISTNLKQAAGRARATMYDANVYIYTTFGIGNQANDEITKSDKVDLRKCLKALF